jgi:UDP-N-acetylmuramoyl-tripeptide--D-alanyl-D-alanine ligase
MGLSLKDCINALENYKAPPGRMSLISGINDSYIIDSSYNASQGSVIDALKVLEVAGEGRKKIAVLGDMREIGLESESAHNIVARAAVKVADKIVLVGPLMKDFFIPEARKLGYETDNVLWFENSLLAGNYVKDIIETGDVILVKGSQNEIYLERVVEELMQDKTDADNLLCRRGEYWDVLRSNYV